MTHTRLFPTLTLGLAFAAVALANPDVAWSAQDERKPAPPVETYPPVRNPTSVHAFSLPDDVRADVVRKALADLGTKDADCRIAYGPMKATARPSKVFVIVEAPTAVDVKDITKAMKKGTPLVESVAWTCFQSSDKTLGRGLGGGIPGLSPRDFVLGMSNDLRWVEASGGFVEFFFTPGKLNAETLADRFHKLAQPFGVRDVGSVVEESFTWPLTEPVDAAAAKRVEKALSKLAGVKDAKIDTTAKTLHVTLALQDLLRGAPPIAMPGGEFLEEGAGAKPDGEAPPRMRFDTNLVFDALDKEHLAVHVEASGAPKKEGEDGKKGG